MTPCSIFGVANVDKKLFYQNYLPENLKIKPQ
jgi:hypothetical protein